MTVALIGYTNSVDLSPMHEKFSYPRCLLLNYSTAFKKVQTRGSEKKMTFDVNDTYHSATNTRNEGFQIKKKQLYEY